MKFDPITLRAFFIFIFGSAGMFLYIAAIVLGL